MRLVLIFTVWLFCLCYQVVGAGYKTANFTMEAPTPELAKKLCESAERLRAEMAVHWLGEALPEWYAPCPVKANVGPEQPTCGITSFIFAKGEVFSWRMMVSGSEERIVDAVLPHEVSHTILASYFRQPLPRWADEGLCQTVECESEQAKSRKNLTKFLRTDRGVPFSEMIAAKEYPEDVIPFYAQSFSVAEWLIKLKGRKQFILFLEDGLKDEDWYRAVRDHYGYNSMLDMQNAWIEWVKSSL